jgi:protein-tyrosine-phosphatase
MLKVIFACVHNAGRSQMAAAFFNQLADEPRLKLSPLAPSQDRGCIQRSLQPCRRLALI